MSSQPFRAGDVVRVKTGPCATERWVVAVYDASSDTAYIAGWPCTMVTKATAALDLADAATDEDHAQMVASIAKMPGGRDPRRAALERVQASGGTP